MKITTETRYKFELKMPSGADYSIMKFGKNEKEAAELAISEFEHCITELRKISLKAENLKSDY